MYTLLLKHLSFCCIQNKHCFVSMGMFLVEEGKQSPNSSGLITIISSAIWQFYCNTILSCPAGNLRNCFSIVSEAANKFWSFSLLLDLGARWPLNVFRVQRETIHTLLRHWGVKFYTSPSLSSLAFSHWFSLVSHRQNSQQTLFHHRNLLLNFFWNLLLSPIQTSASIMYENVSELVAGWLSRKTRLKVQ